MASSDSSQTNGQSAYPVDASASSTHQDTIAQSNSLFQQAAQAFARGDLNGAFELDKQAAALGNSEADLNACFMVKQHPTFSRNYTLQQAQEICDQVHASYLVVANKLAVAHNHILAKQSTDRPFKMFCVSAQARPRDWRGQPYGEEKTSEITFDLAHKTVKFTHDFDPDNNDLNVAAFGRPIHNPVVDGRQIDVKAFLMTEHKDGAQQFVNFDNNTIAWGENKITVNSQSGRPRVWQTTARFFDRSTENLVREQVSYGVTTEAPESVVAYCGHTASDAMAKRGGSTQ